MPQRICPDWGQQLADRDYAALSDSWITREIADAAMLRRVGEEDGRAIVGQKQKRNCAGILFPYYWPGDPHPVSYRIRRDTPDMVVGKDGALKQEAKYLGAPGAANRLYIPPGVTVEDLDDISTPLVILEGEKKSLAMRRLASSESDRPRFVPVAISGVWNWWGIIAKTGGPNGERLDIKGPISDLQRIRLSGRTIFLFFDTNVHTNEQVSKARKALARRLAQAGATVRLANLPPECGVNGVDDYLSKWGPAKVLELLDQSVSGSQLEVVAPPQFESRPGGLFRVMSRGERLTQVQLTNYQAAITANILLDDGVDTEREFEVVAELMGRKSRFTIPANKFASMDWPIDHLGAAAITFPNQREYARTAIQSLSLSAEDRLVYTHTGWRRVGQQWIFLHAAGAIGAAGAIAGPTVRPIQGLRLFELQLPADPAATVKAIQATMRLLELAPPAISFPLFAATVRAVFGEADFSLHLEGQSGAFKSELMALHQQFFGAGMNRLNLPGSWSSTGNALEALAFHAKDTLLAVDDFAPQGGAVDVARYHAAADRLFRAAGNHAGRSRLDAGARLRESKPPRALILSTGEEIPRGQSVRARLLILQLELGAIHPASLTACQRDAQQGLYVKAMSAFIQRMAGDYDGICAAFKQRVAELRTGWRLGNAHARTPGTIVELQAAFEGYLEFAISRGALDADECERLASRCWEALNLAAMAQAVHQNTSEPTARYLACLRGLLASGKAHLEARHGGSPEALQRACGWQLNSGGGWSPSGHCIGWVDQDAIYLEPDAAYGLVQKTLHEAGADLGISEQTLRRRLRDKRILASVDAKRETLAVRRTILGTSKAVLHLLREMLLPEAPDEVETESRGEE